jgi:hypothetical protein
LVVPLSGDNRTTPTTFNTDNSDNFPRQRQKTT